MDGTVLWINVLMVSSYISLEQLIANVICDLLPNENKSLISLNVD